MNSKHLLTKADLCEMFAVSLSTINKWMREGQLTFYKISPRCVRFEPGDVEEFKRQRTIHESNSV